MLNYNNKSRRKLENKYRNKDQRQQIKKLTNIVDINPIKSIITLNINDLYARVKRLLEWI